MNPRPLIGVGMTLAIALAFAGFLPFSASAATGLTIQPIKISETLTPGATTTGAILLTNASSNDVTVDISVEDFVPTSGSATFQFVGQAPGVTSVKDWISIQSPLEFTFKQGASEEVPYTIKAPADAEPGSHFGAIFFKATPASETGSQIKVGTQVGVLVFVTIPGKFEQKGEVTDFSAPPFVQGGPVSFSLTFQNTGTVYFEPKGSINITNMFGSQVASVPIDGYAVLPTGVKVMNFPWDVSGLLLGRYSATASIYDTDGNLIATRTTSFWAVPIWYVVGFIIALLLIFLVIRFLKAKVNFSVSLK